ncbi:acyltransferase [Pseudomonadales bacterium]|nr:acyltransferase [Pseudomonadales bacterium]MDB9868736.1 acyltransferase [Pseudomonadales bacterium]
MNHDDRYIILDLIRGVSALLVCAGHLRASLFESYSESSKSGASILMKVFYFITSLGHESVMIFFVLSGFFVGGGIIRLQGNKFRFDRYLVARVSRLWVVLIPALIFTYIIDYYIGVIAPSLLDGEAFVRLNSGPNGEYSNTLTTFLANVFFLQTITVPVFGSNGPLWSLTNEFWYYILFPLMMIACGIVTISLRARILSCILVPVFICSFYSFDLLVGFSIWIIGALVAFFYQNSEFSFKKTFKTFAFSLFIFSILVGKMNLIGEHFGDIFTGLTFGVFLISLNRWQWEGFAKFNLSKPICFFSEMSYSLYLFHFPVVLLLYAILYSNSKLTFSLFSVFQFSIALGALIFIGLIFWFCFERNSQKVKDLLFKFLDKPELHK